MVENCGFVTAANPRRVAGGSTRERLSAHLQRSEKLSKHYSELPGKSTYVEATAVLFS